jgi:hypothetical protein
MSLRSIAMLICAAALVYSWLDTARADSASIGTTAPAQSSNNKLRFQAIVNGRNLQPRNDQLKSLIVNDISQQDWEKIDRLYDRLLVHNSQPPFLSSSAVERRPLITDNVPGNAASTVQAEDVDQELDGKLNICRGC